MSRGHVKEDGVEAMVTQLAKIKEAVVGYLLLIMFAIIISRTGATQGTPRVIIEITHSLVRLLLWNGGQELEA